MTQLAVNQQFTNVNKLGKIFCSLDWLDIRVKAQHPIFDALYKNGYAYQSDKGCPTHKHYFENEFCSIVWELKKTYIKDEYSHVRIKNKWFYTLNSCSFKSMVYDLLKEYFGFPIPDSFVSRVDFAFDFPTGSEVEQLMQELFITKLLHKAIKRYAAYSGNFNGLNYTNFSAGNRGSKFYYRLYNKTIENTDYQTKAPKKSYITDLHNDVFGSGLVSRFEIECKPDKLFVECFLENNSYFDYFLNKFLPANKHITIIENLFGENYQLSEDFTVKDAIRTKRLLEKYYSIVGWTGIENESVSHLFDCMNNIIK